MGTNYYVVPLRHNTEEIRLQKLKHEMTEMLLSAEFRIRLFTLENTIDAIQNLESEYPMVHIGKNSSGHRFAFAADNYQGLADFINKFDTLEQTIIDEYRKTITLEDFCSMVKNTLNLKIEHKNGDWFTVNQEGYRLVTGEFS